MTNRVWWVHPTGLLLFFILPIFVISALVGGPLVSEFGSVTFLDTAAVLLGAGCIVSLAMGAWMGSAATSHRPADGMGFDQGRFDQVFLAVLLVAIVAHIAILAPLALRPDVIVDVLGGETGAIYEAEENLIQLRGFTSLSNIAPLVFCMCSLRYVLWGQFCRARLSAVLTGILAILIVIYAFIGSERLVLIENGIAFALPLLSFIPRLRGTALIAPVLGLFLLVVIFGLGEYTRSWPYYQYDYDSFSSFVGTRLMSYAAIASNTGAGLFQTADPVGYPYITARWFTQLFSTASPGGVVDSYFVRFGNEEFNNPSGVFAALVDFGLAAGLVFLFCFGLLLGAIYGLYRVRHPIGMLIYPLVFVGLLDLTQIWYWGEPRFVPLIVISVMTIVLVVGRQRVPRSISVAQGGPWSTPTRER